MKNYDRLIKAGCKHQGQILIPPTDKVVPVDIRRLKGWSEERVNDYLEAIKTEK